MRDVIDSISKNTKSGTARLALDYITLDPKLQARKLNSAVVKEYAEAFRRSVTLPPVLVVRDKRDNYYLVDGYHRVQALRELNGIDQINAEIIEGTFTDALWHSWAANRDHGLHRTQAEKRNAIRAALEHPKWGKQTDRKIAQHIGCDHKTVGRMRSVMLRPRRPGEFPKRRPMLPPPKNRILEACKVLARTHPDQLSEFDEGEVAVLRAGREALSRLLCHGDSGEIAPPQRSQRPERILPAHRCGDRAKSVR